MRGVLRASHEVSAPQLLLHLEWAGAHSIASSVQQQFGAHCLFVRTGTFPKTKLDDTAA